MLGRTRRAASFFVGLGANLTPNPSPKREGNQKRTPLAVRSEGHVSLGIEKREGWVGSDLLSHKVALAVPSALVSLTAGFGMEPGGPSPLKPPTHTHFSFIHKLLSLNNAYSSTLSPSFEGSIALSGFRLHHSQLLQLSQSILFPATQNSKPSTISTGQLHTLLRFHPPPINQVVYLGSYSLSRWGVSS